MAQLEIPALMKKAGLVWLSWAGARPAPAWFANVDGSYVVITGGEEQPLPGLVDAREVEVVVPAKPATNRLASWKASVRRLEPGTAEWTAAALVLRTERLNASDLTNQLDRWASEADILVLEPTGDVHPIQDPGNVYETPVGSPATTSGKRPITLHRRARRRPPLR